MFEIASDLALKSFRLLCFPYVGDKRLTLPERMRDYTTDRELENELTSTGRVIPIRNASQGCFLFPALCIPEGLVPDW
jgi:hypothetical protein